MVRLFLLLFMVVALAGAGIIGYTFYSQIKPAEEAATDTGKPAFVDFPNISVSIVRDGVVVEMRTYAFVVETREGKSVALVGRERPRLREIYQRYVGALSQRAGPENLDNVEYLKLQLMNASAELLGQGVVKSIHIRAISTRQG